MTNHKPECSTLIFVALISTGCTVVLRIVDCFECRNTVLHFSIFYNVKPSTYLDVQKIFSLHVYDKLAKQLNRQDFQSELSQIHLQFLLVTV